MFGIDYQHYVPILRSKAAEWGALACLFKHGNDTSKLTPLIELVPKIFASKKSGKANSLDEVLSQTAENVLQNWGDAPIFMDLWHLASTLNVAKSLEMLGAQARMRQLSLIPVTGLDKSRTPKYQAAVRLLAGIDKHGVCFRLFLDDVRSPSLSAKLDGLLSYLELRPNQVDLLIDYQIVDSFSPNFASICTTLPNLLNWRSFTIASGAFPKDLSHLQKNSKHTQPREDWVAWRDQVTSTPVLQRQPSYSDYTIQHPIYSEGLNAPNPSASIRYTYDGCWVIMRGASARNEGFDQWPANAQLLVEQPEFCGATFSCGDEYILERSQELDKPGGIEHTGNPRTWIQAGINHHMAYVLHQIANLHDTSIGGAP